MPSDWTADDSERLARAFLDALEAGDGAAIRATLNDSAVLVLPRPSSGTVMRGGDSVAEALAGLMTRYIEPHATYGAVLANPARAVAEWRLEAQHEPDGYDQFYCWFFEIEDGRITEIREFCDTAYGLSTTDTVTDEVLAEHAVDDAG